MPVHVDIDSLAGHLSGALAVGKENHLQTERSTTRSSLVDAKARAKKQESGVSSTPEYETFKKFAEYCCWDFDETKCSDYLERSHGTRPTPIERACKLRKDEVTSTYLIGSRPVIVTDSQEEWEATSGKWTPAFFSETYSEAEVIANDRAPARKNDMVLGRTQRSVKMRLPDYITYLHHFAKKQQQQQNNIISKNGKEEDSSIHGDPPLYLNGWHAFKHFPELLEDINYPCSHYFLEDHTSMILNEVDKTINSRGRGRMNDGRTSSTSAAGGGSGDSSSPWAHETDVLLNKIFIGPAGNITRLHFDAHQAHGWLSQIKGRKLFVLFPPKDTVALCPLKGEATTQSPIDPLHCHQSLDQQYPNKYGETTEMYFGVLKEGETLLIPAGWWHYAVSLETSITVMRNFYNALTNVQGLVQLFAKTYQKTLKTK
jgi:chloride channel 7